MRMFRTILVPLDGSELAEQALPLAERLATATGAELELVRQTFPGGALEEIPSPRTSDPDPLFVVYRVLLRLAQ